MRYDGTEYNEYKPNTKYHNNKSLNKKLLNIRKVIIDINADIIALQEIESKKAFELLKDKVKIYRYGKFLKTPQSAIGLGIMSRYPIISNKRIVVNKYDKYARYILKSTIKIEDKKLIIYTNHWSSKRAKESKRVVYATALKNEIDTLEKNDDYIILGDLNSDYNEFETFKYNKKLNNTYGITGINQILNTTIDDNFIKKQNILKYKSRVHYNLWLELTKYNRFSAKYKGHNNTPDNIIVGSGLFDNKNISYKNNSFSVFKPSYLYKNKVVFRWNKRKISGYSDHLPIIATFTTKSFINNTKDTNSNDTKTKNLKNSIDHLYEVENVDSYLLTNVVVIYKKDNIAIVKHTNKDSKAILIFRQNDKLQLGYSYNIVVEDIENYNGLKEIKDISYVKKVDKFDKYRELYYDATKIDLFNDKYQNQIVYNLKGKYKKGYLYFSNYKNKLSKIKLYYKKGQTRPEDNKNITISYGHIGIYKSKIQIDFIK